MDEKIFISLRWILFSFILTNALHKIPRKTPAYFSTKKYVVGTQKNSLI